MVDYFSLVTTHSYASLFIGFTVLFFICVNCVGCFLLLLTFHGLCGNCRNDDVFHDWRQFIRYKVSIMFSFIISNSFKYHSCKKTFLSSFFFFPVESN